MHSWLNKNSNHPACISDAGKQYSYSELKGLADDFYARINHRTLLFCLCRNSPASLIGYLACIEHRMVPLLLSESLDVSFVNQLIDKYHPEYLWLPVEKSAAFEGEVVYALDDYQLLRMKNRQDVALYDDLALLLTTSGSTGSPKLVRLSYKNLLANAQSIAQYLEIDSNERPITTLPMYYSFGLSVINSHLLRGATLLLTGKSLMEKDFWDFLKKERATSLSGVPYTFEMLKRLRFFRMDLPAVKTLAQAGGKLSAALCREFAEYAQSSGRRFFVMYGQTEATARMSYLPPEFSVSKAGSIGVTIPGGRFALADENKNIIEQSEKAGELVYWGENVSLGYAETADDLIRDDENGGVLYTGDLAQRDDDGFYYIVGRKKRFIKLFGNRINLDETEQVLKTVTAECACIGTDNKMIVYLTDSEKDDAVRQLLVSKININPSALELRYIDTIPKNSAGKTIYTALSQ